MAFDFELAAFFKGASNEQENARLAHLLEKMRARYGDQVAEVLRLREAVPRMALDEAYEQAPRRNLGVHSFADRATRLAKFKPAAEHWR